MWEPDDYLWGLTGETGPRFEYRPGNDWQEWRSGLKESFVSRLGEFPVSHEELEPIVLERVECDGYVRERVEITTYAGLRMPIYILIPQQAGAVMPAVVACHGHGYGSREIVGLEPDGSERTGGPGLHKDFAVELVKRGFVVAAPELLGFGDRRFAGDKAASPGQSSCFRISAHLMMLGRTIAGARVYETMRVVDYLQSRLDVRRHSIGCMGISGGGLVAAFTAALDERIKAAVVSGYANMFEDSILDRAHCLDNYIPGILLEAEMPELIGLIAPRALLIESGDRDRVFPVRGTKRAYDRLSRIYEAAGASGRLTADFFAGGHEIGGDKAYDWLQSQIHVHPEPWVSDQGDGTFINPVLHADYSDPDVIRAGEDFYMTASSFSHIPGLPILHSKDLVNWQLINHVIRRMELPDYDKPQHGNGVWAPSLRYHDGKYWVFYGDPDAGIFMSTAEDPAGEWAPLLLVQAGKGLIDTCPFWDDDGQAYLIHAYAGSRAGIKHKLRICRMSADGKRLLDEGQIVYDGIEKHPTLEGPKMYKRNGYYYIFAPAGGVATGWQTIFRSRHVYGPYEERIVLHQGDSAVNGPHQGGWVELESGESWFLHFQDKEAYGRVVHLQPVRWVDDWPLMGEDSNGDGIGEPVLRFRKPNVGREYPVEVPASSDEFEETSLGLQWQWQANPRTEWYMLGAKQSCLRLFAEPSPNGASGLYMAPQLLMQKFPAPAFEATVKLDVSGLAGDDTAGLVIFGYTYRYLGVRRKLADLGSPFVLTLSEGDASGGQELWCAELAEVPDAVYLRVAVADGALCSFGYSIDGDVFAPADAIHFTAKEGHWVGAKVGLFAIGSDSANRGGYVDADWFRITGTSAK